eukprot:gene9610-1727_t
MADVAPRPRDTTPLLAPDAPLNAECSWCEAAPTDTEFKVYPQRWWIVSVFWLIGVTQAASWNFFGPVEGQMRCLFCTCTPEWQCSSGWGKDQLSTFIERLANSANIALFLSLPLFAVLSRPTCIRLCTMMCAVAVFLCTGLRALVHLAGVPIGGLWYEVLMYGSMVCNGFAAAWLAMAGPLISANWFPASERTLATALLTTPTYLGVAFGYVIGVYSLGNDNTCRDDPLACHSSKSAMQASLQQLFYIEAGVAAVLALAVVLYFPSLPPSAPTSSALELKTQPQGGREARCDPTSYACHLKRLTAPWPQMLKGARDLCNPRIPQTRAVWLVALVFGIGVGTPVAVEGVLYPAFSRGFSKKHTLEVWSRVKPSADEITCSATVAPLQDPCPIASDDLQAAWLGTGAVLFGCGLASLLGGFMDRLQCRLKLALCLLMLLTGAANVLVLGTVSPGHCASFPATMAVFLFWGASFSCALPLSYEAAVEIAFPVLPEGLVSALLTFAVVLAQIAFMSSPPFPPAGLWMFAVSAGTGLFCALVLLPLPMTYPRARLDNQGSLQ